MSNDIARLDPPSRPADIWATDGGVYLGCKVEGGTDPLYPLRGQENNPSQDRDWPVRSTWPPGDGYHRYVGEAHLTVVAPQGSGKTRKLLMPNLFGLGNWSTFVIDLKGELAAHTALFRAANPNHRVVVIDPFKVIETNYPRLYANASNVLKMPGSNIFQSAGFNPVRALDPSSSTFVDEAKALAEALISVEGSRELHFPQGAQMLVKGLLMALRVDKPGKSDTLGELRAVLGLSPPLMAQFITSLIKDFKDVHPAIAASLGEFSTFHAEDREVSGIRRTAKIQTDWLDSPLIQADLKGDGGNLDFATLKERPTTVFCVLPPARLATHGVWLRLMITSALMSLLRSVEPARVPVLFMLDEFAQLGHLPIIENNIALLRGYGVKLWTIWQSLGQASRTYEKGWETFFATAGAKAVFSPEDSTTREYFSRLGGERLYRHQTVTTNDGHSSSFQYGGGFGEGTSSGTSIGEQRIMERVIKPYELAALDADEAILFMRRGQVHCSICPQPNELPLYGDAMALARRWIDQEIPATPPPN